MSLRPWRRRSDSAVPRSAASPGADATHRFRFRLVDGADRDDACAILGAQATELAYEVSTETDDRVRFDIATTFSPRVAAVLRPLYGLERRGIRVDGFELLDLVTDIRPHALSAAVEEWERFGNTGPYRRRLEVLAGEQVLEACLAEAQRASATGRGRAASWRFAATCVAFNTPSAEARLLREAAATDGWHEASSYVDAAAGRSDLARLTGAIPALPEDALVKLVEREDYAGERASELASLLPPPLSARLTAALRASVGAGDERAYPPPPTIERDDDRLVLWFADDGHVDARDRFERLAEDHTLVEILDADREWLAVRVDSDDPESIVREMWNAARA